MERYFRTKDAAKAAKKGEKDKIVKVHLLGIMYAYLTREEFDDCERGKTCDFGKKALSDGSLPSLDIEPEKNVSKKALNYIERSLS